MRIENATCKTAAHLHAFLGNYDEYHSRILRAAKILKARYPNAEYVTQYQSGTTEWMNGTEKMQVCTLGKIHHDCL